MDYSIPPCHLLMLRGVTPAHKRLTLSGFFKELYLPFRAHTCGLALWRLDVGAIGSSSLFKL